MSGLLTLVQWEILATVGIAVLAFLAWGVWRLGCAVLRALDDPTFWV